MNMHLNLANSMRSLISVALILLTISGSTQTHQLSEKSEIAVMTLGPYQPELYSAFGHSAIRVYDPVNEIDWAFNYGVFDFEQQNFYLNFAKGIMIYQLGLAYYEPFRDQYVNQDRNVRLQYLNLTLEERQQFFDFLMTNRKPENREYLYNYVYDNCASKIPDVLESIFPNKIEYDTSFMEDGKTIRDLMHDYLSYQTWGEWMIDIGLGMQIDKAANQKEFMFLPDYVADAISEAKIITETGSKPLVLRDEMFHSKQHLEDENGWLSPMNFFILLFFIGGFITHINMKRQLRARWLDGILFGFAGVVGCWLTFLWFGTVHLSKWNLDILWAIPFHLPMVFIMRVKKWSKWVRWYFLIVAIWYSLLLLLWAVLPEPLHMALVPFTLLLLLRSAYVSHDLRKN